MSDGSSNQIRRNSPIAVSLDRLFGSPESASLALGYSLDRFSRPGIGVKRAPTAVGRNVLSPSVTCSTTDRGPHAPDHHPSASSQLAQGQELDFIQSSAQVTKDCKGVLTETILGMRNADQSPRR